MQEMPADTALVIIDMQKQYCDPALPGRRGNAWTDRVAKKIARLIPEFKKAGARVYVVHMDNKYILPKTKGAHIVTPDMGDMFLTKAFNSAFEGECTIPATGEKKTFDDILKQDGIKNLFLCGVNIHACVAKTAMHAITSNRYKVAIVSDISARGMIDLKDPEQKKELKKLFRQTLPNAGYTLASSTKILRMLNKKNAHSNAVQIQGSHS